MIESVGKAKSKRKDKDLYCSEMKFRRVAEEQTICSKKLGSEIFISWHQLKTLEKQVLLCVQKALKSFIEKYIHTYNHYPQADAALQTLLGFDPEKEIDGNYSIGKFLDRSDVQGIRKTLKIAKENEEWQKEVIGSGIGADLNRALSVQDLRKFMEEHQEKESSTGPHRLVQK